MDQQQNQGSDPRAGAGSVGRVMTHANKTPPSNTIEIRRVDNGWTLAPSTMDGRRYGEAPYEVKVARSA